MKQNVISRVLNDETFASGKEVGLCLGSRRRSDEE